MTRRLFTGKKQGILASVLLIFSIYMFAGLAAGELLTRVDMLGRAAHALFSYSLPALAGVFALRQHSRREWLLVLLIVTPLSAVAESVYLCHAYPQSGGFSFADYLSSLAYLAAVTLAIYLAAFACGRLFRTVMKRLFERR